MASSKRLMYIKSYFLSSGVSEEPNLLKDSAYNEFRFLVKLQICFEIYFKDFFWC